MKAMVPGTASPPTQPSSEANSPMVKGAKHLNIETASTSNITKKLLIAGVVIVVALVISIAVGVSMKPSSSSKATTSGNVGNTNTTPGGTPDNTGGGTTLAAGSCAVGGTLCGSNQICCSNTQTCVPDATSRLRRAVETDAYGSTVALFGNFISKCVDNAVVIGLSPAPVTSTPNTPATPAAPGTTPISTPAPTGGKMIVDEPEPAEGLVPTVQATDPNARVAIPWRLAAAGQVLLPSVSFNSALTTNMVGMRLSLDAGLAYIAPGASAIYTFDVNQGGTYAVSYTLSGTDPQSVARMALQKGAGPCTPLTAASEGLLDVVFSTGKYNAYQTYAASGIVLTEGAGQMYILCVENAGGLTIMSTCIAENCNPGTRSDRPGLIGDGDFEQGVSWWTPQCAHGAERVTSGLVGGPASPRSGQYMYRFRAGAPCATMLQSVNNPEMGVTYHITAWVWMPTCACTTDFLSENCPYIQYEADGTITGAGTTLTAVAGMWNVISGTVVDMAGTGINLQILNFPVGTDVYLDDIQVTRCAIEDFRAYAQPRIEALHRRDVSINIGARPGAGGGTEPATILLKKHIFPFGAAATKAELAYNPAYSSFFLQNFNAIVDETNQKWHMQEPGNGIYDYTDGDYVYNYAVTNDLYHRGHDIFQEGEAQAWLTTLPRDGSQASLQAVMWKRLNDYISRYDAHTINYDVINEITHFNKMITMLPCTPGDPTSPCICWYAGACPVDMGLDRDTPLWLWAFTATRYVLTKRGSGAKKLMQNDYCNNHYCGPENALSNVVKAAMWVDNDGFGLQSHIGPGKDICGFDLTLRIEQATNAVPGSTMWWTELDIDDPDMGRRTDGYEHSYLAAYASAKVGGVMLWGWAKNAIAPTQDSRPNTLLVTDINTMTLNQAGERILGATGLLKSDWATGTGAYDVPLSGGKINTQLYEGIYTLTIAGCTTTLTVPDGTGALNLNAGGWVCAAGGTARTAVA